MCALNKQVLYEDPAPGGQRGHNVVLVPPQRLRAYRIRNARKRSGDRLLTVCIHIRFMVVVAESASFQFIQSPGGVVHVFRPRPNSARTMRCRSFLSPKRLGRTSSTLWPRGPTMRVFLPFIEPVRRILYPVEKDPVA